MLKIRNITKSYADNLIIQNLNFDIYKNKINAIVGKSGCGKTTLLNIISGLDKDFKGDIKDIKSKNISYVFQEPRLIEYMNVYENLDLICKEKQSKENIDLFLRDINLLEFKHYLPKDLSGGMKQKINIIRAFLTNPDIIIMDEPFKSMDIMSVQEINKIISIMTKKFSPTIILVEHNLDLVYLLADYVNIFSKKEMKITQSIKDIKTMDKKEFTKKISKLI